MPGIFIIWGLSRLASNQQATAWPLAAWIIGALALLPVGIITPRPFEVDHATGNIIRPGSVFPLVRNILVFALQYAIAVLAALHADGQGIGILIARIVRCDVRLFSRLEHRAAARTGKS